ncbi:MAG TPA: hypothetical protein VNQ31_01150, partial [Sphingomonadaceae bacterium]|nr:hypothetical protein [Sphingomonadaceae bacterium]
ARILSGNGSTHNYLVTGSIGLFWRNQADTATVMTLTNAGALDVVGPITRSGLTVWDAGNDGAGSGLDADLLDGLEAADFVRLAQYADRSFAAAGYQVLPSGLIIQWCRGAVIAAGEVTQSVTFPIVFPNACLDVQVATQVPNHNTDYDMWYQVVGEPTKAGCTLARAFSDSGSGYSSTGRVVAIGY